jgi:hypothetical protein
MTSTEALAEIRAILNRLEASQKPSPVSQGQGAPVKPDAATGDSRLSFRDGTVCYWEVGTTKAGTPRARIGIEWNQAGNLQKEYWDWYDLKAAEAVDPLGKGDRVQIVLKPWKDKHIVNAITVVSRADLKRVPFPSSLAESDEIPF